MGKVNYSHKQKLSYSSTAIKHKNKFQVAKRYK